MFEQIEQLKYLEVVNYVYKEIKNCIASVRKLKPATGRCPTSNESFIKDGKVYFS